jgi:hypothetical protein
MQKQIKRILPLIEKPAICFCEAGIHVKTGIHSGDWRCTACEGQAIGSNLIKPKCDYCELI